VTITHGYATVLEFKDHLQDSRIDDGDEAVERVIEASSRIIDGATQRRFWADEFPSSRLFRATPYTALFVDDFGCRTLTRMLLRWLRRTGSPRFLSGDPNLTR
jgi:hypothetical protein